MWKSFLEFDVRVTNVNIDYDTRWVVLQQLTLSSIFHAPWNCKLTLITRQGLQTLVTSPLIVIVVLISNLITGDTDTIGSLNWSQKSLGVNKASQYIVTLYSRNCSKGHFFKRIICYQRPENFYSNCSSLCYLTLYIRATFY